MTRYSAMARLLDDIRERLGAPPESGWVNVQCPYCDDHGEHLGVNLKNGGTRCLRCGARPTLREFLAALRPGVSRAVALARLPTSLLTRGIWRHLYAPLRESKDGFAEKAREYMRRRQAGRFINEDWVGTSPVPRLDERVVFILQDILASETLYYSARAIPRMLHALKSLDPLPSEGWANKSSALLLPGCGRMHARSRVWHVVLTEGIFDALAVTHGDFVGVPLLGTMLSPMQAMKLHFATELREYAPPTTVALDQDAERQAREIRARLEHEGARDVRMLAYAKDERGWDPCDVAERKGLEELWSRL